jgi:hypothetical protein
VLPEYGQELRPKHVGAIINKTLCNNCRSQWPCGLRPAGTVGSNHTGAWMFVCCGCCVLSGRGLCDDHFSRGVLPTVVCRCVWSRNLKNEEAKARVGPQRHRKKKLCINLVLNFIYVVQSHWKCTTLNFLYLLSLQYWTRWDPNFQNINFVFYFLAYEYNNLIYPKFIFR